MAQQIKLKRSAVSGKVPTTAQLQSGEIAINTADGKLFFKRDDTTIQSIVATNTLITGSLELSGPVTGSDTYIDDWGSVSASLASIESTAATSNVYTANGTLSGNRQVNGGSNSLSFTNLSSVSFDNTVVSIEGPLYYGSGIPEATGSALNNTLYIDDVSGEVKYGPSLNLQKVTSNGATTTNSITVDASITATTFTGSLLRISQNGSGLRMTNVGAFDNDGSDNFRIFSTNDLILATNGDSGTAVTFDQTTKDATFEGDINTASTGSFGKVEATSIDLDSYTLLQSGKVTVNNNVLGVIGGTYSGTTYAGLVMDYVLYNSGRTNQRTGTLLVTANSSEAVYSETVTTDIGSTDGAEITVTIGSGNFRANLDNKTGSTMYVTYNIKLLKV